MEVRDIVKEAVVIPEDTPFAEAVRVMVTKQTNSLLVVDDEGCLVGEVHISDLLDAIVPDYLDGDAITTHFSSDDMFDEAVRNSADLEIRFFMTADTTPVLITDGLMSIAATAIAYRKTHIPVVDASNRPIGVISRRGVKHIVANALGIKDDYA